MTNPTSNERRHHVENEMPAPRGRTLFLAVLVFAASIVFTGWIGGKDEDVLTARLTASSTVIVASHDGRLAKIVVADGAIVDAGGPLVRLVDSSLQPQIVARKQDVELRTQEWKTSLAKADVDLAWRLRTVESEILQTRLQIAELLQKQFDQQTLQLAWKDRLEKIGTGTKPIAIEDVFQAASFSRRLPGESELEAMIQHESKRNAAEVSRVQLQLCEERLDDLQRLKEKLPERIRSSFGTSAAEARVQDAKTALAALKSRQPSRNIVSTKYGTVGKYRRGVGESVKAGESLVEVVDDKQRHLIVEVPADKLAQLLQQKTVRLRFPDGKKYEGRVGERIDRLADGRAGGTTAIRIEPAGRLWPEIPLGSAVDVLLGESE